MKLDAHPQSSCDTDSPDFQTLSTPSIAIIGGGFAGICAGIQLEKQLGIQSYTIFDENEDFGGTWLVNKYPGAACDIESALYSFSFELNPNWSKNFASQAEIHEYIVGVAQKYGLYAHARFSTLVNSLEWLEEEGKWEVRYFDKKSQRTIISKFDYTIWAVGALRVPLIPPEFKGFKGRLIHSAEWDPTIDLKGKRVGVIGSGASAIQIIPSIAPEVEELHSYQRTPSWVVTRVQFEVPTFIQNLFIAIPFFMWLVRFIYFVIHEFTFFVFQTDSMLNSIVTIQARSFIRRKVALEETQKKLMPDYPLGCKRILLHENYYSAFNLPNVHLHREKIMSIEGKTIKTHEGVAQELDILILATGFKVQEFFAPLQITGRGKWDLLPQWKKHGPNTFYGIMTRDAPNAFMIAGSNSILAHNSIIFMIECQCDFVVQVIGEAMSRKVKAVAVKKTAEDRWIEETQRDMKSTIFQTGSCNSWYRDARGVVTALWPKNCISYFRETRKVNFLNMDWTF